jgi:hypothetical protein
MIGLVLGQIVQCLESVLHREVRAGVCRHILERQGESSMLKTLDKIGSNQEYNWLNDSLVDIQCSKRCKSVLKGNDGPCGVSNLARPQTSIALRVLKISRRTLSGALAIPGEHCRA